MKKSAGSVASRVLLVLASVALLAGLVSVVPAVTGAHTVDDPFVTDLIAGGGNPASGMDVGDVLVWNDDEFLYVKYVAAPSSCITETHLHVATSLNGIPQRNGNPPPGQFDYGSEYDPCVTGAYTYRLDLDWKPGTQLYIAAHAVVERICGYGSPLEPPSGLVQHRVAWPGTDLRSYFDTTVWNGGDLDGVWEGWCIDTDRNIVGGTKYWAQVFSSYAPAASGLVDYPEHLDLVNYIINQDYVGQPSACGGTYTYGDVQRAMWELLEDDYPDDAGLGAWEQCRVNEILADAQANGEGFVPGCGQYIAIILKPVDPKNPDDAPVAQINIIVFPVSCCGSETAWGDGYDFPGRNWAMYFTYIVQ